MTWSWEAIAAVAVPVVGWIVSVESRIAKVFNLEERVKSIDKKVDRLIDHLIDNKD